MSSDSETEPEQQRKLFLGGLNYETTEEGLKSYFSKYGELVDVVVMRFADSRRSRGFGFITFAKANQCEECFAAKPHEVDKTQIETKRATPREESKRGDREGSTGRDEEGEPESHRKLFIGGLDYSTTDEGLKEYFEQFGELVDCVVMKFRDTKRSRGFGFVTYASSEMVDKVQDNRPHMIDGHKVETKRATPREDIPNRGRGGGGSGQEQKCQKIFVGGLKDGIEDEDLKEYFSKFGNVVKVEQMMEKSTGRKRGFGFVEYDDYDPVDKAILAGRHRIKDFRLDIQRAVSKQDMNMRPDGRDGRSGGGRGGPPAPWGNDSFGYGFGGGSSWGQPSPWQSGGAMPWTASPWGGGGNFAEDTFGPIGGGNGGPMRSQLGGGGRSAPYSTNRGSGGGFGFGGGQKGGRW